MKSNRGHREQNISMPLLDHLDQEEHKEDGRQECDAPSGVGQLTDGYGTSAR